jgi:membrane fusion protein (multidrug efflux system)
MKKFFAFIAAAAVVAALVWVVWIRPPKPGPPEATPNPDVAVQVGKITRATLRGYVTAYGMIETEPAASAKVAPPGPGVIAAVKCLEGQHVDKDALLIQMDSRAADVAVSFAEKNFERQQKLSKVDGTSIKTFQDAEQQLAAARAQQGLLQIRSPISGVVTRVNVKAGESADVTTVLAEVMDLDRLVVTANVPSDELAALKTGDPAEVITPDSTNVVSGSVTFVSSQVDPKTGCAPVRVALPAGSGLRPGQFETVRIVSAEHKDCLAVPLVSVAKDQTGSSFIAKVTGEKALLVRVKEGLRDGDLVEVEADDLAADMPIVTEGAYGLVMAQQDATKIRVQNP